MSTRSQTAGSKWAVSIAAPGLLFGVLGALLSGRAVPPGLGDVDAVNFARSLYLFDPLSQSPHLPGYPVFVLLARAAHRMVGDEVWALTLPGQLLFVPACGLLYAGLASRLGRGAALGAVALTALAPALVLNLAWPASDGLGLALLLGAVGAGCLPRASMGLLGAALFGLCLGARPSYLPLVLPALWWLLQDRRPQRGPLCAAFALSVAAWLVPMLALFGGAPLLEQGVGFLSKHMSEFGGSAFAGDHFSLAIRLQDLFAALGRSLGLADHPVLGPWALGAALGALSLGCLRERRLRMGALALTPYLLWLLLGQNLSATRHLMPLVAPLGACLGWLLAHGGTQALGHSGTLAARLTSLCRLVAPAMLAWVALVSTVEGGRQARAVPAVELVDFVRRSHPPAGLLLMAGDEARVFQHLQPAYRVVRPVAPAVAVREACRATRLGVRVWFSSDAPGASALRRDASPLHSVPGTGRARAAHRPLTLYRFEGTHCPRTAVAALGPSKETRP